MFRFLLLYLVQDALPRGLELRAEVRVLDDLVRKLFGVF
jgi:hypothetical protein